MHTRIFVSASFVLLVNGCSTETGRPPGTDTSTIDGSGADGDSGIEGGDSAAADAAPLDAADAGDAAASPCASDTECDDGAYCDGIERCAPTDASADAHGCVRASAGPCATGESCDETARSCTTTCVDADRDGACASADCDDEDPTRHPMAHEVCDAAGVDEDCDPATLGDDADGDGHVALTCCNAGASGALVCGDDCDDARSDVSPSGSERCDAAPAVDENCDGRTNEGCLCDVGTSRGCSAPGLCAAGTELCDGASWSACTIGPVPEACNLADDDCDGAVDEGVQIDCWIDEDDDGWAEVSSMLVPACAVPGREAVGGCPVGTTGTAPTPGASDCLGLNPTVHPGAPELCTLPGRDDDCDGYINDGCACTLGAIREPCALAGVCGAPDTRATCQLVASVASWVCDVSPATEVCDTEDDDCDGLVDEGLLVPCWTDADGDGFPPPGAARSLRCSCGAGTTTRDPASGPRDCDDARAIAHPGALDAYDNGLDDDCDGVDGPRGATVFVGSSGDDLRTGRSPAQAVRTVARGRAIAAACTPSPCTVVVTTGTFSEAHALTSGVSMWGGYGPTFAALVPSGATVLAGTSAVGLRANGITSPTRVGRFTIVGRNAVGTETASIAVLVTGTSAGRLELVDTIASAGRGRDGVAGLDADAVSSCTGPAGGSGGSGGGCGSWTQGAGSAGSASIGGGAGGRVGTYPDPHGMTLLWSGAGSDDCGGGCNDGHPGVGFPGMDGFPGPAALGGSSGSLPIGYGAFDATSGAFVMTSAPGGGAGHFGGGGGGGGEGGDVAFGACVECFTADAAALGCSASQDCSSSDPLNGANGGSGGAGGCGGLAGSGGQSGGGSFGIVAVASSVTLTRVSITLGGGGDGGRGGAGGAGTPGLAGAGDGAREDCCNAPDFTCHRSLSGNGGHGGHGGFGSGGGGGAGGDAGPEVGVALVGSTAALVGTAPTPTVVRRGLGGTGGSAGTDGDGVTRSASGIVGRPDVTTSQHRYP